MPYCDSEIVGKIGPILIKCEKKCHVYKEADFFPSSRFRGLSGRIILKRVGNTDSRGVEIEMMVYLIKS